MPRILEALCLRVRPTSIFHSLGLLDKRHKITSVPKMYNKLKSQINHTILDIGRINTPPHNQQES